jgi:hypothetical protein
MCGSKLVIQSYRSNNYRASREIMHVTAKLITVVTSAGSIETDGVAQLIEETSGHLFRLAG